MNRNLITALISLTVLAFAGIAYYNVSTSENEPGENKYRVANQYLVDGDLEEALRAFNESISLNPSYKAAYLGKAITLMQMARYDEAREEFERAIQFDEHFAEAYANRGILHDRTGNYEKAVHDYREAVKLRPELDEGPGLIWRFLHLVDKKPPTLSDRADYIEAELKKPEPERLLRIPEIDDQQRMYKK